MSEYVKYRKGLDGGLTQMEKVIEESNNPRGRRTKRSKNDKWRLYTSTKINKMKSLIQDYSGCFEMMVTIKFKKEPSCRNGLTELKGIEAIKRWFKKRGVDFVGALEFCPKSFCNVHYHIAITEALGDDLQETLGGLCNKYGISSHFASVSDYEDGEEGLRGYVSKVYKNDKVVKPVNCYPRYWELVRLPTVIKSSTISKNKRDTYVYIDPDEVAKVKLKYRICKHLSTSVAGSLTHYNTKNNHN